MTNRDRSAGEEDEQEGLLRRIDEKLTRLLELQENNPMGDITGLTDAINKLGADATADHDAILAAFSTASTKLDDLTAQVAALQAGQLDQATIDSLKATAEAADTAINDAAKAVTPVVAPPAP